MDNKYFDHIHCFHPLREDHRSGLLFCWRIKEGIKLNIAPHRIVQYIMYFWDQNLDPHLKEEELLLLGDTSRPVVKKALEDHSLLYNRIRQIITAKDVVTPAELTDLVNLLDTHIQFEEKKLFPLLKNTFTVEQLKQIHTSLLAKNISPGMKNLYHDEFWKNEKSSL
ncbi:MAG: hemerythrin domain-containing protein [Chitinophagaceae bacterium]|nr:hemerythrin domain-containing protein [Chitinophagaceae bacterium]